MVKTNLTAVIAVVDKDKKYLARCINSIEESAKNAGIKIFFILVANGTNLPLNKYPAGKFRIIKNKENIGFAQAINQGIREAKNNWCILACPDTITTKECISNIIYYTTKKTVSLLAPKIVLPDGSLQFTILPIPTLWNIFIEQSYLYKILPSIFSSPLSNTKIYKESHQLDAAAAIWWLVKRDVFLRLGGFDKKFFLYFEDVDLCRRIRNKGYVIAYEPKAEVTHLPHQSTEGIASGKLYEKSLKAFFLKHYGRVYSHTVLIIFKIGCLARIVYWSFRIQFTKNKKVANFGQRKIRFCKEALIGA